VKVSQVTVIDASVAAVMTHCKLSRRADQLREAGCKYAPKVHTYPTTIIK
jgi:hypothetical protein